MAKYRRLKSDEIMRAGDIYRDSISHDVIFVVRGWAGYIVSCLTHNIAGREVVRAIKTEFSNEEVIDETKIRRRGKDNLHR